MKSCCCSHCGAKQPIRLKNGGEVIVPCVKCGKSLKVIAEKDSITVKAKDPVAIAN